MLQGIPSGRGASVVLAAALVSVVVLGSGASVGEPVDWDIASRIRQEGFEQSQVMELAWTMTDLYGPRFANSPSYDAAADWAAETFRSWGLDNVALEPWGEFGYGWEGLFVAANMVAPRAQPLIAYPVPGTRGTDGPRVGEVVHVPAEEIFTAADLEPYRERVAGRFVMIDPLRRLGPAFTAQAVRLSDSELEEMARLDLTRLDAGPEPPTDDDLPPEPLSFDRLAAALEQAGAIAVVRSGQDNVGPMDKGVVTVSGSGPLPLHREPPMPTVVVATEQYNRMLRLLQRGHPVRLELEIRNAFHDDDPLDRNVIAEIVGTDLRDEVVMIGGHFDAEPAGTGATDNASGSAIVMEAMRLLEEVGARPRRTIRAALWGAEEAGLLGSRGYVAEHFGGVGGVERKPAHDLLSVYFNVDWYGRFRGVYLQGNDRARPIFEAWMSPFRDLGMEWIVPGNTGGSDHMAFLEAGLPGFQFIQDDLEFFNVTFHTNMDVYDRLVEEDLKQAAVILASFAYHAAIREGDFPYADGIDNGRRWHK